MVILRVIANILIPDETLSGWFEIPWRVYVAVMEGSAAETDGDSNWPAKVNILPRRIIRRGSLTWNDRREDRPEDCRREIKPSALRG